MAYKKGQSGNPKGRPKGRPDKRTQLRELLNPHAHDLVNKAVERALEGDMTALRLCLDRIIPPMKAKDDPVAIHGPEGDLPDQGQAIIQSMRDGVINASDAVTMLQALTAQSKLVEVSELEQRITVLEQRPGRK